jgi:hypothetical protein
VERSNKASRWLSLSVGLALYYLCGFTLVCCLFVGEITTSGRRGAEETLIDAMAVMFQSATATTVFTVTSLFFGFALFLMWRGFGFRLRRIRLTIQHLMALALIAALACASLRYLETWYILMLCSVLWPLLVPFIWLAIQMIRSTRPPVALVIPRRRHTPLVEIGEIRTEDWGLDRMELGIDG